MDSDRIAVIAAIGENIDRPASLDKALEPIAAMAAAVRAADIEAGGTLLSQADSIDIVNQISWPYAAPTDELCKRLGIEPARRVYGPVGGETPLRFLHEAAMRIAAGESAVAIICGGEAHQAVAKATSTGLSLPWTPRPDVAAPSVRGQDTAHPLAKRLGVHLPVTVYPLYEAATSFALGQSPSTANAESGGLWSSMSDIAAANPYAWIRRHHSSEEIVTPSPANRAIATPYTKLMVANIAVNQAAAIIVTSLAKARAAGLDDGRLVFLHEGFSAGEPKDYLARDRYDHCVARDVVLDRVTRTGRTFDLHELYSCFPVVPKAARRRLGLSEDQPVSTAGGLTFFGAPLNNYMSHAACAMVRGLRERPGSGLLYGQGGFMTQHFALCVGSTPSSSAPPPASASVQDDVDRAYGKVPRFETGPSGPAVIESHTVIHGRDGDRTGVVVVRLEDGARSLAKVPEADRETLALLEDQNAYAIGCRGEVRIEEDGLPRWRAN